MNRYLGITLATILTLLGVAAHATDATLLPNAIQYFMDANGRPLANGKVYMYVPSTTTPKTTWTSATKGTAQPLAFIPLGISGKPANPIYGDGAYRQLVKDSAGNTIWDFDTASTGSGGGTAPAFSEGVMVGTIIEWVNPVLPAKYLYTAGQAVVRATYPELLTAITSQATILCQNTIATISVSTAISDTTPIGAVIEASCFAPGTTVIAKSSGQLTMSSGATTTASVAAVIFPWGNGNGSTTFNVPDKRGRTSIGRNNMLGTASSVMTSTYYKTPGGTAVDPNAIGAIAGSQSYTMLTANLPPYTPVGTIAATTTLVFQPVQSGTGISAFVPSPSGSGASNTGVSTVGTFTGTAAAGQISTPFTLVQPSVTADFIIKALPDDTPSGPGVSSIQGMTGAISCGTGMTCTAQTISATAPAGTVNSGTINQLAYYAATGTAVSSSGAGLTWNGALLKVSRNATTFAPLGTTSLYIQGADAGESRIQLDAANSDAVIAFGRMNGTFAAPTKVLAGEQIMGLVTGAIESAINPVMQQGGAITAFATTDWSITSHPTDFRFYTIATGSINIVETFRLLDSGGAWLSKNTVAPNSVGTTTPVLQLQGANTISTTAIYDSYGTNTGSFGVYRTARGTAASFTATQNNDTLGGFGWVGASAANTFPNPLPFGAAGGAFILAQATQNWTGAAQGASLQFYTTPNGSASIGGTASVMVLNASGGLSVGVNSDPGVGVVLGNIALQTTATTVGALGTCNAGAKAQRKFVTDSNAASYTAGIGAVVAAGGTTNAPVVCDGTNWRIGANDNVPADLVRKFA